RPVSRNVTTNSFTDTGLTNSTTYYYQVSAVNGSGQSAKSAEVSATPQAPPAAPTGLTASPGDAKVTLTWNTVTGATSYNVYRGTATGSETLVKSRLTLSTYPH